LRLAPLSAPRSPVPGMVWLPRYRRTGWWPTSQRRRQPCAMNALPISSTKQRMSDAC